MTRPGTSVETNLPKIRETSLPPYLAMMIEAGLLQSGTRMFRMGKVRILLSPPDGENGWHMSISHNRRYPTWDEVAKARYELAPDELTMVMMLPPREVYVNLHEFTFHLHELKQ